MSLEREGAVRAPGAASVAARGVALWLYLLFVFVCAFPLIFMGRVVSPAEALYGFEPWRVERTIDVHDPAAREAALTVLPMLERRGSWDASMAAGRPIRPSEEWSPWKLLPRAASRPWGVTLLVFSQLTIAYWSAFLWLLAEGFRPTSAATGAAVCAFSGVAAVSWLLPDGFAFALLPLLLWTVVQGERRAGWAAVSGLIALLMVLSASQSCAIALAIGAARALAGLKMRASASRAAIAIAFVAVCIFGWSAESFERGPLDLDASGTLTPSQLQAFVFPERLGAANAWQGDVRFGSANDFAHSTVFVGRVALFFLLIGAFARADRRALGWAAAFLLLALLLMIPNAVMPAATWRLALPAAAAFLVARGAARLGEALERLRYGRVIVAGVLFMMVTELAFFAAAALPYSRRSVANVSEVEIANYLGGKLKPYRIAAFFDYLPANAATLVNVEDIRAKRLLDQRFAQTLETLQLGAVKASGRVEFDPQRFDFSAPMLSFLNVRYLLEHRDIDLVRWQAMNKPVVYGREGVKIDVAPGRVFQQYVAIERDDIWSIDLFAQQAAGASPFSTVRFTVARPETGEEIWSRTFTHSQMQRREKFQLPLKPYFTSGNVAEIRIAPMGAAVSLVTDANDPQRLTYGLLTTPIVLEAELGDGRVFENLAAKPRFFATWDIGSGAAVGRVSNASLRDVPPSKRRVHFAVSGAGERFVIRTRSAVPFFLVSSEKLSDLRVAIDGKRVDVVPTHDVFAGVFVEPGARVITFERARDRSIYYAGGFVLALLFIAAALERRAAYARLRATSIV